VQGLDPGAVAAELADGVLTIRIPKPETLKPNRVEIKASGEARQLEGAAA
jgi:HSP20 family molecular chaperone IbpA